jgi:guanyl-specific ribonuclease Sa
VKFADLVVDVVDTTLLPDIFEDLVVDDEHLFAMTLRKGLSERGPEALKVARAEIGQIVEKRVWHPVMVRDLTAEQRVGIIRSSMFLKDKYFASGVFEKFKARLVAGGDQQDKELYESLSSPTVSTSSVLAVAAIAANQSRSAWTCDIEGAYLNAPMKPTGVLVFMRLDPMLTKILVGMYPEYAPFVQRNGTVVVQLDQALYGCVEASRLWFEHLTSTLIAGGYIQNSYDRCVFNRNDEDGVQLTICLHVDDLLVTCCSNTAALRLFAVLERAYPGKVKTKPGPVVDYLGMTLDFRSKGEVKITMDNNINQILEECGVTKGRTTPAGEHLFDIREDDVRLDSDAKRVFHSIVCKVLFVAMRVKPECMTAVSFLTARVQDPGEDDQKKLYRLLGYLYQTKGTGIVLRIGDEMKVSSYIDAAYGVHKDSGKSHTGSFVTIGEGGPIYVSSGKQKVVTKSSTEAELIATSDKAGNGISLNHFLKEQGHAMGPVTLHQDNTSTITLLKRGGPASERTRHLNIREFWLTQQINDGVVSIQHLPTEAMYANILTKPVQGAQFLKERQGLTYWNYAATYSTR